MELRLANAEDAPAMRALVERAYALYVPRIGRRPRPMDADHAAQITHDTVLVAERDGALAGVIVLVDQPDHVLVENVAVDPAHQDAGIGRRLLAAAENHAHARETPELRLYTNAAMSENIARYPHLGFSETGRRGEHGFERVFFVKRLR